MPLAGLIDSFGKAHTWENLARDYAGSAWRVPADLCGAQVAVYPLPLLLALGRNDETDGAIRVTSLLGDPRREALKAKFNFFREPHELLFMAAGSAFHSWLHEHDDKPDSERRLYMEVSGQRVTGRPDHVDVKLGLLVDYKTTAVYGLAKSIENGIEKEHQDWIWQTRFYALLLKANGIEMKPPFRLFVMARDWRKSFGSKPKEPRMGEFSVYPGPADAQVLEDRVRRYLEAMADVESMPACADREDWGKTRDGKPKRCAEYCEAKEFCKPWLEGRV